jgi:hypothetical protein
MFWYKKDEKKRDTKGSNETKNPTMIEYFEMLQA